MNHLRFIAIIVDIIFAAIEDVAPLSKEGFNSTISTPVTFFSSKEYIISNNSLDVIPAASVFQTPGAKAGSKTSKS